MTEVEARAALREFDGRGGVEHWIAGQLWQVEPDEAAKRWRAAGADYPGEVIRMACRHCDWAAFHLRAITSS